MAPVVAVRPKKRPAADASSSRKKAKKLPAKADKAASPVKADGPTQHRGEEGTPTQGKRVEKAAPALLLGYSSSSDSEDDGK